MSRGTNGPATGGTRDANISATSAIATTSDDPGSAASTGRGPLDGKCVVLGVTGGIAAYKAAELCRLLVKAGARVRVILTEAAGHFITPLTLQTLSGHAVARDLFDLTDESEIGHIRLADEADLIVIAPATADAIARIAAGMANDLLAAVVLASRAPVLLAPAMNVNMWENPITQSNLGRLLGAEGTAGTATAADAAPSRFSTVGPDRGALACGWVGQGRLIEPAEILAAAEQRVAADGRPVAGRAAGHALGDLAGREVVVTAGPTREPIDDVRFLGNRSSGKMGFAIAAVAAARGARVTLVAGPVGLPTPVDVMARVDVESADDMARALAAVAPAADAVVMAAAVADFRPQARIPGKLARRAVDESDAAARPLAIELTANPDLLAGLGRDRRGELPLLVGFAAEAVGGAPMLARAREKLAEKRCDIIVANDISAPGTGFDADDNQVTLVFADGRAVALARASKLAIAQQIWDHLVKALAGRARAPQTVAEATTAAAPRRGR